MLEVAENKLKVIAIECTSNNLVINDPQKKQGCLDFIKEKWIDKSGVQLIVNDATRRESKIDELIK